MSLGTKESIVIEDALPADAVEIHSLQRLAYLGEAKIENDYSIPPLKETFEQVAAAFAEGRVFKVLLDGRIIGSARTRMQGDTCFICRVVVHPEFQNRGIGSSLMRAIENQFTDVARFELYTSGKSDRNLHFYGRLGYTTFTTVHVPGRGEMVYLEKRQSTE